ncbi:MULTISPECIES: formylglycine-generating enzyme family protein [Dyella]|uniref:Sulfatase-modifying factor enzyme-like domain-containing protein n=2 Tax=Dyella TaxID=231454 RepID=A0A4V2NLF2_9GAMM|nr:MULTISPECIES: SUMF1/EgtB/PvdO family nonheme iron enzyme [Dyella]TBR35818.1 hypothetical protein EYV96_17650 [Dyella terrae]TCI08634.1 hypothetical protein EZM97_28905 [Dyella soli]
MATEPMIRLDGGVLRVGTDGHVQVDSFWIDRRCVTNEEFACFVDATGFSADAPDDPYVAQVSYDDACAFASWAGKRLPTTVEAAFARASGVELADSEWTADRAHGRRSFRCVRDLL